MFCTSTQPTQGVMPLEGARCWSTTVITHYSFVPEKCQGHSVSVPEKEQKQTPKPWRLLWNKSVFPLALLIKPLNILNAEFPCRCWWGTVSCVAGRCVSSKIRPEQSVLWRTTDPSGLLIQTSAWSRINVEFRPGYPGVCPVSFWKLPSPFPDVCSCSDTVTHIGVGVKGFSLCSCASLDLYNFLFMTIMIFQVAITKLTAGAPAC